MTLAEDSADFTAISRRLRAWRKELSQVVKTEAAPRVHLPFQGLGLESLRSCLKTLDTVARGKFSNAIRQSVQSVVITRAEVGIRKTTARVLFYPAVYSGGEILIPWEALRVYDWGRKRLRGFIATLGRLATVQDIINEFSLSEADRGVVPAAVYFGR